MNMKMTASILLCSFILSILGCSNESLEDGSSCIQRETTVVYEDATSIHEDTASIWETVCEPFCYYRGNLSDFLDLLDRDGMTWIPEGSAKWQNIKEMRPFLEWARERKTIPIAVSMAESFRIEWVETVENSNGYFFRLACNSFGASNERVTFHIHIQPLTEQQERLSLKELITQQNTEFTEQEMNEHASSKFGAYYTLDKVGNTDPVAYFRYRDCLVSVYDIRSDQWQDSILDLFDIEEYTYAKESSAD